MNENPGSNESSVKQYERVCIEEQLYEDRTWRLFCWAFLTNIGTFALIRVSKVDVGVILLLLFLFSFALTIDLVKQRYSALKSRAKRKELESAMQLDHLDFSPASWGERLLFPNSPSNALVMAVLVLVFLDFVFLLLYVIYGKLL